MLQIFRSLPGNASIDPLISAHCIENAIIKAIKTKRQPLLDELFTTLWVQFIPGVTQVRSPQNNTIKMNQNISQKKESIEQLLVPHVLLPWHTRAYRLANIHLWKVIENM